MECIYDLFFPTAKILCVTKCYTVYTIDMYTGTQVLANVACVTCCVHELRAEMIIQNCMRMIGCGVEFLGPQEFYTHRSSGVRGGLSPDWTTGPLPLVWLVWFQPDPSLVACLALPINPLLSGRPRKAPNHTGDRMTCWNLRHGCEQYKRTLPSLLSNNFPILISEQCLVNLICEVRERLEDWNQCCIQRNGQKDIHTCETLSSGLQEGSYWPKNGLRSNLIASKGGSMPPDKPSWRALIPALWTWPLQAWWLRP